MNKKKASAALAAVMMFIKTQEEAMACSAPETKELEPNAEAPAAIIAEPSAQPMNVWGISGRQTHMQANAMMQLRMFK